MRCLNYFATDQRGNESMQTVLIMALGALILLGVNGLLRHVAPTISRYVNAAVTGESVEGSEDQPGGDRPRGSSPGPRIPTNPPRPHSRPTITMQELLRQANAMSYSGQPGDLTSDGLWRIPAGGVIEDHTGFRAIILTPADGSETGAIVAFAGTDLKTSVGGAINDLINNLEQTLTGVSPQYIRAVQLAASLKERYQGNIYVTGHSLGGGQAALASIMNDVPGAAFNPAPLGGIASVAAALNETRKPTSFTNYSNRFDPISNLHHVSDFPGHQYGQTIVLEGDHGWPSFGLSDHYIENMKGPPR